LAEVVDRIEIIYHLAAQPGISEATTFPTYVRNNITATHRLLEAACSSPSLKCLVNGSTSSIYGDHATESEDAPPKPTSYYGVTKLAAEQLVMAYHRQHRLPCCSLRLFSVYGPRERPEKLYPLLIRSIFEDREFPMFEGSEGHSRSFTFVGDIVDGLVSVLDHLDCVPGEIINLGSDLEMKTVRGIEIVEQILERKARIVRRPARMGDQIRTRANIDRARRILGYDPKSTPRQGLQAEVDWFRTKFFSGVSS
jgi:nucleoside-diphosphate-sugar epimerase